jgi:hypothetical protein
MTPFTCQPWLIHSALGSQIQPRGLSGVVVGAPNFELHCFMQFHLLGLCGTMMGVDGELWLGDLFVCQQMAVLMFSCFLHGKQASAV